MHFSPFYFWVVTILFVVHLCIAGLSDVYNDALGEANSATVQTTLYENTFASDRQFNRTMWKMFKSIVNRNETVDVVPVSVIVVKMSERLEPNIPIQSSFVSDFMTAQLRKYDGNKDGNLTFVELKDAVKSSLAVPVVIDKDLCRKARTELSQCARGSLFTFMNITSSISKREAVSMQAMCESGISSLVNYGAERCIVSQSQAPEYGKLRKSDRCSLVKQCVNKQLGFTDAMTVYQDGTYIDQRLRDSVATLKWGSLLFLVFGLLALVPVGQIMLWVAVPAMFITIAGLISTFTWSHRAHEFAKPFASILDKYANMTAMPVPELSKLA